MKIILFNSKNQVLDIFLSDDIEIDGDALSFNGNKLTGLKANYIIVNDEDTDAKIGDTIPEILKEKDKKQQFIKKDDKAELELQVGTLQAESAAQLQAIADIYEMLTLQGIDPSVLSGGEK